MDSSSSPWPDLLPELLSRVIDRLPLPADHARFRAVCRPWRTALRSHYHVVSPRQLPWVGHPDGTFPDRVLHDDPGFAFPGGGGDTRLVGATKGWLVLRSRARWSPRRGGSRLPRRTFSYLLQDALSGATVPLPALDAVIGKVSYWFGIRKVLMRSTQDDIMAVTTNNWNCPIILCRPGKPGAWLPRRKEMPYAGIFDVAFHGGKLYGITEHDNLVVMGLGEDDDGVPTITSAEYVIEHPPPPTTSDDDDDQDSAESSSSEDEDEEEVHEETLINDSEEEEEDGDDDGVPTITSAEYVIEHPPPTTTSDDDDQDSAESSSSEDEDEEEVHEETLINNDDAEEEEDGDDQHNNNNNDDEILYRLLSNSDDGDGEVTNGYTDDGCDCKKRQNPLDLSVTTRYLVESNNRLLMVRRHEHRWYSATHSCKVEVLEADLDTGAWVPVPADASTTGNDGTTDAALLLFISQGSSESIPVFGKAREDGGGGKTKIACYFADEHDAIGYRDRAAEHDQVVNYSSHSFSESLWTWILPRQIVV